LKVGHELKWLFCLVIKVVNRGTVFGMVNPANQCGLLVVRAAANYSSTGTS